MRHKRAASALAAALFLGGAALADDKQAAKPAEMPKEEKVVVDCNGHGDDCEPCQLLNNLLGECFRERTRITARGHIDQGYTANFDYPDDRLNYGRLFDDRANDYRLNQIMFTLERALEHGECFDWGFKYQAMYGSDARFVHYLGILDNVVSETVQPDLVEAYGIAHLPILTCKGVDIKFGHFVTLHGAEVIDATSNPLYSHTYMFNFGIPFKHTGVLTTVHVNDWLDVHTGIVNGINTGWVDNNDALSFHGGLGMKFNDDKIVMMHSLHIGAENDSIFETIPPFVNDAGDLRVIYDAVTTVKLGCEGKLTSITDVNIGRDYGFDAEWYGAAQYFIYALSDKVKPVVRLEMWRDDDGFASAKFGDNDDFINIQRGEIIPVVDIDPATAFGGAATYTALTLGVNLQATDCLLLRPEARWDWASGAANFNDFSDSQQFTLGIDAILKF